MVATRRLRGKPLLLGMTEVELIPNGTAHPYGEMPREGPRKKTGPVTAGEERVFVNVGSAWDGTWPDTVQILKRDWVHVLRLR